MKMFKGQIEWKKGYELVVFTDSFSVYDENGYETYFEDSNGDWVKIEYDERGNETYYENSNGFWCKSEYDERGNEVYYEDSYGNWRKSEYDECGNIVYYEDSYGEGIDNRKKTVTLELTEEQIKQVREMIK